MFKKLMVLRLISAEPRVSTALPAENGFAYQLAPRRPRERPNGGFPLRVADAFPRLCRRGPIQDSYGAQPQFKMSTDIVSGGRRSTRHSPSSGRGGAAIIRYTQPENTVSRCPTMGRKPGPTLFQELDD